MAQRFEVVRQLPGGETVTLAGEDAAPPSASGPPIVLLHGLSATRRNVVQGSKHLLRRGYRLIGYDARGHGESSPAPQRSAYEYADLIGDLQAVLAQLGLERAVLAGSSMGATTAMTWALENPERVPALVQITPAYTGAPRTHGVPYRAWERLAEALEHGGVEAFVDASEPRHLPDRWREITREANRQRMARHRHPSAVADALRMVPRSLAFRGLEPLEALAVPTLVIATRDEADELHPFEIAQEYARRLPRGQLVVEEEGESPLAWQGARLSRAIGDFLERVQA